MKTVQLLANNIIASASGDDENEIKIWNVESGECIRTLYGYSSTVYSLQSLANNQ